MARIALRIIAALVAVWLLAPTLVVLPMSFTGQQSFAFPPPSWSTRWYEQFFSSPGWYEALFTSAQIALLVMVVATVLGTVAAFGLVRGHFPGKGAINALLMAPMIVPLVIIAVGVYAVFLRWQLVGTTVGFVAAHTCLALPFVVVTVSTSLRDFDRSLERAALSLGATPLRSFFAVTLPLIMPGVLTGALFAFITSFDEVVVAIFLVSPEKQTLPVQMYTSVTREVDPTIAAASSLIFVTTTMLLALAFLASRRRERYGH